MLAAFREMDRDGDGRISVTEMQVRRADSSRSGNSLGGGGRGVMTGFEAPCEACAGRRVCLG